MVGRSVTVHKDTKSDEVCAFYCDLCQCALKDSQAWLDHINGKKHNRLKGMSMVVQRVDVDTVKAKLASLGQRNKLPQVVLGKRFRDEVRELSESSSDGSKSEPESEKSEGVEPKTN